VRPARVLTTLTLTGAVLLATAAPALAASGGHLPLFQGDILGIGHLFGGALSSIGGAVLGGLKWTVGIAAKFVLATIGGLVKLLIPTSWARDALGVMHWIVAVPDYAGTITSPGGGRTYGFSGINALRDLFTWLGAALLPLTLTFASTRAMLGSGGHPAAPLARVIVLGGVLISYPWWWSQLAAVVNQITSFIFALHPVTAGTQKLMEIAVGGQILAGWAFGGVLVMGAVGLTLLAVIFLKVAIILAGALLYALGPLMIALAPTESGMQVARGWASAVLALLALPLLWAATFAVGALLINDSNRAGALVGGDRTIAHLLGGLLLGLAGLASLWMCLKLAREIGGMLRTQMGGLLALAHARGSSSGRAGAATVSTRGAQSVRSFTERVGRAGGAAVGALSGAGPVGAAAGRLAGGAATFARGGLIGLAAGGARAGAATAAPAAAAIVGRSRAGAVAMQMGRAARGSWQQTTPVRRGAATGTPNRNGASAGGALSAERGANNGAQRPPGPSAAPKPQPAGGVVTPAPASGRGDPSQHAAPIGPQPRASAPPARSSTPPPAPPSSQRRPSATTKPRKR
jgi:hypothetical protein